MRNVKISQRSKNMGFDSVGFTSDHGSSVWGKNGENKSLVSDCCRLRFFILSFFVPSNESKEESIDEEKIVEAAENERELNLVGHGKWKDIHKNEL